MQMDLAVGSGAILGMENSGGIAAGGSAQNGEDEGVDSQDDQEDQGLGARTASEADLPSEDDHSKRARTDDPAAVWKIAELLFGILLSFASSKSWLGSEPEVTHKLTYVGNIWAYKINQALKYKQNNGFQFLGEYGGHDGTASKKYIDIVLKKKGITLLFIEAKMRKTVNENGILNEIWERATDHKQKYRQDDSFRIFAVNLKKSAMPNSSFEAFELFPHDQDPLTYTSKQVLPFIPFRRATNAMDGKNHLKGVIQGLHNLLSQEIPKNPMSSQDLHCWERDMVLFCICLKEVQPDFDVVWEFCATCIRDVRPDIDTMLDDYVSDDFYKLPQDKKELDATLGKADKRLQNVKYQTELQQCLVINSKHYHVTLKVIQSKTQSETMVVNLRALLESENKFIQDAIQEMRKQSSHVQPIEVHDFKSPPCFDMFYTQWRVENEVFQIIWPRVLLGQGKIPEKWQKNRAIYYNFDNPDEYTTAGIRRLFCRQEKNIVNFLMKTSKDVVAALRKIAEVKNTVIEQRVVALQPEHGPALGEEEVKRIFQKILQDDVLTRQTIRDVADVAVDSHTEKSGKWYKELKNTLEESLNNKYLGMVNRLNLLEAESAKQVGDEPGAPSEETWKIYVQKAIEELIPGITETVLTHIENHYKDKQETTKEMVDEQIRIWLSDPENLRGVKMVEGRSAPGGARGRSGLKMQGGML